MEKKEVMARLGKLKGKVVNLEGENVCPLCGSDRVGYITEPEYVYYRDPPVVEGDAICESCGARWDEAWNPSEARDIRMRGSKEEEEE